MMALSPVRATVTRLSDRIGIIWRLLVPATVAVVIAVAAVEIWTIRSVAHNEEARVERELSHSMDYLKARLRPLGEAWSFDRDGRLMLGGSKLGDHPEIVEAVKEATGAVATIFEGDQRITTNVINPDGSRGVGTTLAAGAARDAVVGSGTSYRGENRILGTLHRTIYEPIRDAAGRQVGILFVGVPVAHVYALLDRVMHEAIIGGLISTAACCLLSAWLLRRSLHALTEFAAVMHRLANRDMAVKIIGVGRTDEIGKMAGAIAVFRDNMLHADRLAAEQARERAAKERRQAAMDRHTQDFATSIAGVMASLVASAESMRTAARAMAEAAGGVREQANGTAMGAEKASVDLGSVAAAVEQMTSSVSEISRQVSAAAQVAREAVCRANTSQETMKDLAEATSRIGDIVRLISDIAGQTNLLALNATIEAARAGDAGRGFAVVAGEVKALAAQTATATHEIGGQIESVRAATNGSISAMADVATFIGRLDEVTAMIAAAVEEQSATTREIATNLHAVTAASNQTAVAMVHVVSGSDDASAVSQQVLEAAGSIGEEAKRLRGEVDQFLAAVRDDTGDRRHCDRVRGNGATAVLAAPGHAATSVVIKDIARGGAALTCDWKLPSGTGVTVELPGAGGSASGRAVRSVDGVLAVVFAQDAENLARIDRAIAGLGEIRRAA